MISSTNFHRFFKKSTLAGYISISLAASCMFAGTALAGPAEDTIVSTQPVGPGQSPGSQQPEQPVQPTQPVYVNPNYYDLGIQNPIVVPTDLYSYEQMEQDITAMAARYGSRMKYEVIGQSLDGRNIYNIIVGNPNAPKKILIQGAIHAREYVTIPLMMQQLEHLLAASDFGYFHDKPLPDMLNNVAIHFVPMANPDGVSLSQFGEAAIRSADLRGMIQACYAVDLAEGRTSYSYDQYLKRWKSNARGVDLNHNFDAGWASLNANLSHNSSHDYKGTAPLSEPESMALANLANLHNYSAVINYHAMGNVIYWDTANNNQTAASLTLAQLVSAENSYQILSSKGVGGYKDWLQQRDNSVAGITIELGRSAAPVSFSEYPAIWQQNKSVPGLVMDFALTH